MKKALPKVLALLFFLNLLVQLANSQSFESAGFGDKNAIQLRNNFIPEDESFIHKTNLNLVAHGRYLIILLQFNEIPNHHDIKAMNNLGIEFISYLSNKTYYAAVPKSIEYHTLKNFNLRRWVPLPKESKIDNSLFQISDIPSSSRSIENNIYVSISYPKILPLESIVSDLKSSGYIIHKTKPHSHQIELLIDHNNLLPLASKPYVWNISPVTFSADPLNYDNTTEYGSRKVHQLKGLKGKGVFIGVGDDSRWDHLDGLNRVSNHNVLMSTHGEVVAGLIAGGGNLEEIYTGHAPEAQIVTIPSYLFLDSIEWLIDNYDIVLANHSYGNTWNSCPDFGRYTNKSFQTDQQLVDNEQLMHVISCGNSGSLTCNSYPKGFHTILDAHQASKNGLDVANLNSSTGLTYSSSKGPVIGGRLKPEICARGNSAVSTSINNSYGIIGGTSSAAPVVTGIMALMYEQYKELNANQNPNGGLMKAIICNTADDLGNPGPDFSFGFGKVNAGAAIKCIEGGHYLVNNVTNGNSNFHQIFVPPNTQQIKVLLYWNDPPADLNAAVPGLIHQLDLSINDPSGTEYLPWVLDPTPSGVDLNATRGVDQLNNIEQITIKQPAEGVYRLNVLGTSVPLGVQEYYIAYQFVENEIELIHPSDGKALVPNEEEVIHWSSPETNETFSLFYSADDGNTWSLIDDSIDSEERNYTWSVPSNPSDRTRIKIRRGNLESTSELPFSVIRTPENVGATMLCESNIRVKWNSLEEANGYEVFKLSPIDTFMTSIGITTDTNFVFQAVQSVEPIWIAVRAISLSGLKGRRSTAIPVYPNPRIEEFNFTYGFQELTVDFFHFESQKFFNYLWDFGDGNTSFDKDPIHTYSSDGTYNVCLTVFDGICSDSTYCKPISISNDASCRIQDSLQLVALLNSQGPLGQSLNWTESVPLQDWYGVTLTADGCHIKELAINNQLFLFTLPGLNLPELTKLDLGNNFLFGELRSLSLPKATELILYNNQFAGELSNFSNIPNLTKLVLNNNNLVGEIPNFNLPNLNLLYLNDNKFSGSLPDFSSTNISFIYVQNNLLTGHIPDYQSLNLGILQIHNNFFTYDGMEENLSIQDYSYSPQAKIPVLEHGHHLYVEVAGTYNKNTYKWYNQNDQLLSSKTGDKYFLPSTTGNYYCEVTNSNLGMTLVSEEFYFSPRLDISVQVWLEGAISSGISGPILSTKLNSLNLLPGQRTFFGNYSPPTTPAGQPYSRKNNDGHWSYEGKEGIPYFEYSNTIVDWMLVTILSDLEGAIVWQSAALLHSDGEIEFLKLPPKKDLQSTAYYILVEHRNHMGVMTPEPIAIQGNQLAFDFRYQDSYTGSNLSKGQKNIAPGVWAMFSGEGFQNDPYGYDINGMDKLLWVWGNGVFSQYSNIDFNMDGDVTGVDKILWSSNNGIFSNVPKY